MIANTPDTPLVLRGATWLGADPEGEVARTGDIRIVGGAVEALGALRPQPGDAVLDAARMLVLPGLFDAVTDTALGFCAGCLDAPDPQVALARLAAARAALDPAKEAARTARGAAALLAAGTTEVVDVVRAGPALPDRVAARRAALAAAGLRADLAIEIPDDEEDAAAIPALFSAPDDGVRLQAAIALPDPEAAAATWARIAALGVGGRDLYLLPSEAACLPDTAAMLAAATRLARAVRAAGGRAVATGLPLRSAAEAEAAAAEGLAVALTPEAEAMLARPRADARVLAAAGVDVRLGSGTLSNGGASMQTVMRLATMLDRPSQQHVGEWLTNRMVLDMATRDRHGAARRIAPGAPADLAIYDLNAPVWTPLNNLDDQIVSSETGGSVLLTLAGGRIVWRRDSAPVALAS